MTSIAALLRFCSPAAIFLAVSFVIVNSFNAVIFGWARPHVTSEWSETFSPFIADSDAPSPVIVETDNFRIVASAEHIRPAVIGSCACQWMLDLSAQFNFFASAASAVSGDEFVFVAIANRSADTTALPMVFAARFFGNYRPESELIVHGYPRIIANSYSKYRASEQTLQEQRVSGQTIT